MSQPIPIKRDALRRLRSSNLPISQIVDIGEREQTPQLIDVFPDKHHQLFEPVSTFFADIERFYAAVPHTLHKIALSDQNAEAYLVQSSLNSDGVVTHSQILSKPETVDGKRVVACDPFPVRRFESLPFDIPRDFLLKVDVDGLDLNVLRGFGVRIRDASAVIVEVTHRTIFERMESWLSPGFSSSIWWILSTTATRSTRQTCSWSDLICIPRPSCRRLLRFSRRSGSPWLRHTSRSSRRGSQFPNRTKTAFRVLG
jgi:hypothetical protein